MVKSIVLFGVVALIVGAYVLWLSAKWLRFRNPSFSISLRSMAVAIGVSVIGVLVMPKILPFWAAVGVGMGFVAVAGVISVALFFREPVWKTVAAISLVLVSEALLIGVCYVIIALLFALAFSGSNGFF